tara:strand:- start:4434 stop:5120 length:687 start_codon:yes stop_codon:yes gene_type:complete
MPGLEDLSDDQLRQLLGGGGQKLAGLTDFEQAPRGGNVLNPEIQQLVQQTFDPLRQLGTENILNQARSLAGTRGAELNDEIVSEPTLRNQALFESQLGGQQAGQTLNLNQRANEFNESALLNRTSLFNQAREQTSRQKFDQSQFQELLKQRAFNNRLSLGQLSSQTALGLGQIRAGIGSTTQQQFPSFAQNLQTASQGLQTIGLGLGGNQSIPISLLSGAVGGFGLGG